MDNNYLAELLFPNVKTTPDDMEKRYPPRALPEGARVTRIAPSPTGYLHIGALYGALTDERTAHLSNGVFYLRIEDTDAKREVSGAAELFITMFEKYGIHFDEGAVIGGDRGDYGPYRQSERTEIYQTFAKQLVREGKAYPCFCTDRELEDIRARQEAAGENPGYYGKWAVWRNAGQEAVEAKLKNGDAFVIRLRSEGDPSKKVKITDAIKGELEFPQNDQDFIILKSDGTPPYHFAHAVDDHLMRTTHVIRGEEWLATLPWHVELFAALGFRRPVYCHTATLLKQDGESKRKISKRKDPEADVSMFIRKGYPAKCLIEYVMTLLNSNYEDWRRANPDADMREFPFSFKKMSVSGALFDFQKLDDVSKNTISRMPADEVYAETLRWAEEFDPDFASLLAEAPDYAKSILAVGRGGNKPRKDFTVWADVKPYMSFFYDSLFECQDGYPEQFDRKDIKAALEKFLESYSYDDDADAWFGKLKTIAGELGYAPETKLYKKNPESYKGHVGDISMFVRVAVTGRQNSPDMYEVMRILGRDKVVSRVRAAAALL